MTLPKSCDIKLPDGSAVVGLKINGAEYLITDAVPIENHGKAERIDSKGPPRKLEVYYDDGDFLIQDEVQPEAELKKY